MNPDRVQLKYASINKELIETVYKMPKSDLKFLYSPDGIVLDEKSSIINCIDDVSDRINIM